MRSFTKTDPSTHVDLRISPFVDSTSILKQWHQSHTGASGQEDNLQKYLVSYCSIRAMTESREACPRILGGNVCSSSLLGTLRIS